MTRKRQKFFVEPNTQGAILLRVLAYWATCVSVVGITMFYCTFFSRRHIDVQVVLNQTLLQFGPALIAAVLILPVILVDSLRVSNRMVGPIIRLRRAWQELAQGKDVEKVTFRGDDFWTDLANDFNSVRDYVSEVRQAQEQGAPDDSEDTVAQSGRKTEPFPQSLSDTSPFVADDFRTPAGAEQSDHEVTSV